MKYKLKLLALTGLCMAMIVTGACGGSKDKKERDKAIDKGAEAAKTAADQAAQPAPAAPVGAPPAPAN